MWLRSPSLELVIAFVQGYDTALAGGLLAGFREWMIVRVDGGSNLAWTALVPLALDSSPRDTDAQIEGFFQLLEEFLAAKNASDGLRRILHRYEAWLRGQDWYTPDYPGWIP